MSKIKLNTAKLTLKDHLVLVCGGINEELENQLSSLLWTQVTDFMFYNGQMHRFNRIRKQSNDHVNKYRTDCLYVWRKRYPRFHSDEE
jgi:hypothetical protein